jgi:hypothetical protein
MKSHIKRIDKKRLYEILLITFAVFAAGIFIYFGIKKGCFLNDCMPKRSFTVYDLSIPPSLLPNDATPLVLRPDRGNTASLEEVSSTVYMNYGKAIYIIDRFSSKKKAIENFNAENKVNLFTSRVTDMPKYMNILEYKSKIASNYNIACGYILEIISCIYKAQYEEYFVFFNSTVMDDNLNPDNYLSIIRYIDGRMDELLP